MFGGKGCIVFDVHQHEVFGELFAARLLVGLGEAALSPAAISLVQNGVPGNGRRLKAVIGAARNDTIEGLFQMADNETLTYRTTSGIGASTLVWAVLFAAIAGDVR